MKPTKEGACHRGSPSHLHRRLREIVCAGLAAVALGGASAPAAENPMIGAAQRELKRQQFYTGEITNAVDDSTKEAVRRFQIRRGLKVTGDLDGATLAELATTDAPATTVSTDPQPEDDRPPARERSQSIVRDDLDILRELEAEGTAPPPQWNEKGSRRRATSTTSAENRETPAAEPQRRPALSSRGELSPSPANAETPPREIIPPQRNYGPPQETASERTTPSTARGEPPSPITRQSEVTSEVVTETRNEGIGRGEILETVDKFVNSWQQPTPDQELSFYAESVNYFDQGKTAHSAIARDQRNYYRRWPERDFSLIGKPEVVRAGDDSATVRYRFQYELRNGTKAARGRAEHFVRFERDRDRLKVVSLRERKVTD